MHGSNERRPYSPLNGYFMVSMVFFLVLLIMSPAVLSQTEFTREDQNRLKDIETDTQNLKIESSIIKKYLDTITSRLDDRIPVLGTFYPNLDDRVTLTADPETLGLQCEFFVLSDNATIAATTIIESGVMTAYPPRLTAYGSKISWTNGQGVFPFFVDCIFPILPRIDQAFFGSLAGDNQIVNESFLGTGITTALFSVTAEQCVSDRFQGSVFSPGTTRELINVTDINIGTSSSVANVNITITINVFRNSTLLNSTSVTFNATNTTPLNLTGFTDIFFDNAQLASNEALFAELCANSTIGLQISTASFQLGDGGNFSTTEDTQLQEQNPDTNAGGAVLRIRDNAVGLRRTAVIKFPLIIGNGSGQIPLGAFISDAQLELTVAVDPTNSIVGAHQVFENWTQFEATWNDRLTGTPWSNPGALPPTSSNASVAGTQTPNVVNDPFNWTVTSIVQSWVNGDSNFGVLLNQTVDDIVRLFNSEEGNVTRRPKLYVSFTIDSSPDITFFYNGSDDTQVNHSSITASTGAFSLNFDDAIELHGAGEVNVHPVIPDSDPGSVFKQQLISNNMAFADTFCQDSQTLIRTQNITIDGVTSILETSEICEYGCELFNNVVSNTTFPAGQCIPEPTSRLLLILGVIVIVVAFLIFLKRN